MDEQFVTLNYRQSGPFMRRVGMYNMKEISYAELIAWLRKNHIDFHLSNLDGQALHVTPMAREYIETMAYFVQGTPYLVS